MITNKGTVWYRDGKTLSLYDLYQVWGMVAYPRVYPSKYTLAMVREYLKYKDSGSDYIKLARQLAFSSSNCKFNF